MSSIKVVVLARPLGYNELHNSVGFPEGDDITFFGTKQLTFDYVFSDQSTHQEIYNIVVKEFKDNFFVGYSVNLLAYGQTSGDKITTLSNCLESNLSSDMGIIPQTIFDINQNFKTMDKKAQISVKVSTVEVYNEENFDLLSPIKEIRALREENRDVNIPGLIEQCDNNVDGVFRCFMKKNKSRAVEITEVNKTTSSHGYSIFTLHISNVPLHLVDLTRSRRVSQAGATGDRVGEGINIKLCLLALGPVISSLAERDQILIVPNLNFQILNTTSKENNSNKVRPPKSFFTIRKAEGVALEVKQYEKLECNNKGLLIKRCRINDILCEGLSSKWPELELFQENVRTDDNSKRYKKSLEQSIKTVKIDKKMMVAAGQMKDSSDAVILFEDKSVKIKSSEQNDPWSLQSDELVNTFAIGDYVRITSGSHEGETGMVVKVEVTSIFLYNDSYTDTLKVDWRNIEIITRTSNITTSFHNFLANDFIQIDKRTVAVIITLQNDRMEVLTNSNKIMLLDANSNYQKKANNRTMTLDVNKNELRVKDVAEVTKGSFMGKGGEVKYIWKNFVFIYNSTFSDNNGFISVKGNELKKVGATANLNITRSTRNPFWQKKFQSVNVECIKDFSDTCEFKKPFTQSNDSKLIGSLIKIIKDPFKGCYGIIKKIEIESVFVELHSLDKIVKFSKEDFSLVDSKNQLVDSSFGKSKVSSTTTFSSSVDVKTQMYGLATRLNKRSHGGACIPLSTSSHTPGLGPQDQETSRRSNDIIRLKTPPYTGNNIGHVSDNDDDVVSRNTNKKYSSPKAAQNWLTSDSGSACFGVHEADEVSHPSVGIDDLGSCGKKNNTSPQSVTSKGQRGFYRTGVHGEAPPVRAGRVSLLRDEHVIRNVIVQVKQWKGVLKTGVIQELRDGVVVVHFRDENQTINVERKNLLKKEAESGDKVLVVDPTKGTLIGLCLDIERGDAIIKFNKFGLELHLLENIVPFHSPDIFT